MAPILVALPLVAGGGSAVADGDIALLAFKATVGCCAVLFLGSSRTEGGLRRRRRGARPRKLPVTATF